MGLIFHCNGFAYLNPDLSVLFYLLSFSVMTPQRTKNLYVTHFFILPGGYCKVLAQTDPECARQKTMQCIEIYVNSLIFLGTMERPIQLSILLKQLIKQILF